MSPAKKGRQLRPKKFCPTKLSPDNKKKYGKESIFDKKSSFKFQTTKSWIRSSKKISDFEFDKEIMEINSDEDSDEYECNLKELEVNKRLKIVTGLLLDCNWIKTTHFPFQKPLKKLL